MMRPIFLLAATALVAWASAGAAKVPSRADTAYALGKCIAHQDRAVAGQLLRELPLSEADTELTAARLGSAGKCAAGRGPVSTTLLRGGLAQALLLKDFPRFGVQPEISEASFIRFDLPVGDRAAAGDNQLAARYKLADCVVRNQAIKTERLFRAAPGSSLEGRVFAALMPYVSACQGSGQGLNMRRAELRSLMAQAAYNVSVRYWTGELWSAP